MYGTNNINVNYEQIVNLSAKDNEKKETDIVKKNMEWQFFHITTVRMKL